MPTIVTQPYTPRWTLTDNDSWAQAKGKYLGAEVNLEAFRVGPAPAVPDDDDDDDDDIVESPPQETAYQGTEYGLDRLQQLCPYGHEGLPGAAVRGLPVGRWLLFVRP